MTNTISTNPCSNEFEYLVIKGASCSWSRDFFALMKRKICKLYFYTQLSFHISPTFAICSLCQDDISIVIKILPNHRLNRENLELKHYLKWFKCNLLIKVFKSLKLTS